MMLLASCGMFEHRDFESEMAYDDWNAPFFMPDRDFDRVAGDSDRSYYYDDPQVMRGRTPATAEERQRDSYQQSLKRELFNLENGLDDYEYGQYLKVADDLGTVSQKIYFLRLPREKRSDYLRAKNIISNNSTASSYRQSPADRVYSPAGVTLGMSKEEVENFLGRPSRLEVAGDPKYENERWTYASGETVRHIYFESGSVGGWTEQ